MKHYRIIRMFLMVVMLGGFTPLHVVAAEGAEGTAQYGSGRMAADRPVTTVPSVVRGGGVEPMGEMPTYKPPMRGAPGGRIGGGTRGPAAAPRVLTALAPDHEGFTVQEQPPLYWFLSQPTKYPVEFTLTETNVQEPLLQKRVGQPLQAGIHCIRLSDSDVRLKTGVQYQWVVAIVPDPNQRSRDVISGGEIQRVDFSAEIRAKLERTGVKRAHFVFAEAGLWYDALSSLGDLIATKPGDSLYHKQRAALLRQVGLKEAASYEGKQ